MNRYHRRTEVRYLSALPLFDWAARFDGPALTNAGLWVCRHKRVRPALANAIAELAGLGLERSR